MRACWEGRDCSASGGGIAGFCPGPAVVGLLTLDGRALVFMATFCVGMWLYELWLSPDLKPAQA
ncbi:MAG: DUF6691 family protein [Pseudomonadota bacterium]